MCMKAMTKSELAMMAGVSARTFARWLHTDKEELERMGVTSRMRLMPPIAVRYICQKYGIDLDGAG